MADITAVDLGQALAEHGVEVVYGGKRCIGFLANPEAVARRALETLAEREPLLTAEDEVELAKALEDPELIAAQQVLDALAPLETADPAAVLRVLRWACERFDL